MVNAWYKPIKGFNPRAREGRDAYPRGMGRGQGRFNPRAREGRDLEKSTPGLKPAVFQSTRP